MAGEDLDSRLARRGWTVTPSGCWEFSGSRTPFGHGQIRVNYRLHGAHRVAYMAWVGEIPSGMYVCHRCDNPPCINPAHLFLGRDVDNIRDMHQKRRNSNGERSGGAKLTDAQVAGIRARYARGELQSSLASEFGVTPSAVSQLVNYRRRRLPTNSTPGTTTFLLGQHDERGMSDLELL